jgi:hypothetical protein
VLVRIPGSFDVREKAISETLKSRNSAESSEYRVWASFIAFGILQEFVQEDSDLPQSGKFMHKDPEFEQVKDQLSLFPLPHKK